MNYERRRFVLFVLAGGSSAVFNVASRILFSQAMRLRDRDRARLSGRHDHRLHAQSAVRVRSLRRRGRGRVSFGLRIINLVALAQVWVVSVGLARLLFPAIGFGWHAETVAHVTGVAVPVFTSYFGHKHFSFAA